MRRAKKKLRLSMEQYHMDEEARLKHSLHSPLHVGNDSPKLDRSQLLSPMESIFRYCTRT